jgi:hypothetical protein
MDALKRMRMTKTRILMAAALVAAVSAHAAVVLDYDFNGTAAGTTLQANMSQYDYTSNQEYVGSNAVANTLGFTGGSSGTDYIIRDKGTGHENALYWKTLNPHGVNAGIYLQKIDMTAGGANASQVVRVSWSFDILGYDTEPGSTDIVPENWTVKVRYDNTSQNLDVSDAWYAAAATAQTFGFLDDTTGETATDGTWTTVSGYYDVAVGTGAAVGGIQIRQPLGVGGYTSAGGIFLDNISVDVTAIPEPATLGLVAAFGAGVLFIRKRFMI